MLPRLLPFACLIFLFPVALAQQSATAKPDGVPDTCPVTKPSDQPFVPPFPKPANQKLSSGGFAGFGNGGTKGWSDGLVTGLVSGTPSGFAVADCWARATGNRKIKQAKGRRRGNIESPAALIILQLRRPFPRSLTLLT